MPGVCRERRAGDCRGHLSVAFTAAGEWGPLPCRPGSRRRPWARASVLERRPLLRLQLSVPLWPFFYPLAAFSSRRVVTLKALLKGLPMRRSGPHPPPRVLTRSALPSPANGWLLPPLLLRSLPLHCPAAPAGATHAHRCPHTWNTATALTPDPGVHWQKEKKVLSVWNRTEQSRMLLQTRDAPFR